MIYKVVRDSLGNVVCFGPNDDNYDPNQPYVIEAVVPTLPIQIPKSVTMRQARTALFNAGLLDATNAAIASMSGDAGVKARIDWEFSQVVMKDWPLVNALTTVLRITSEQLDQLFITAATL